MYSAASSLLASQLCLIMLIHAAAAAAAVSAADHSPGNDSPSSAPTALPLCFCTLLFRLEVEQKRLRRSSTSSSISSCSSPLHGEITQFHHAFCPCVCVQKCQSVRAQSCREREREQRKESVAGQSENARACSQVTVTFLVTFAVVFAAAVLVLSCCAFAAAAAAAQSQHLLLVICLMPCRFVYLASVAFLSLSLS